MLGAGPEMSLLEKAKDSEEEEVSTYSILDDIEFDAH